MFWVPTFSEVKLTPVTYTFVLLTALTERSLVNARAVPAEAFCSLPPYANVNVNRHSIVKGTVVFTTKAVKSPSAALSLLNRIEPPPPEYV